MPYGSLPLPGLRCLGSERSVAAFPGLLRAFADTLAAALWLALVEADINYTDLDNVGNLGRMSRCWTAVRGVETERTVYHPRLTGRRQENWKKPQ